MKTPKSRKRGPGRPRKNADPFEVWGWPPQIVLDQLGRNDHERLRRYVLRITSKVYRLAYDLGAASNAR